MINYQLRNELDKAIREKRIRLKYPKGYRSWKKKFDAGLRKNRGNVDKTLEDIHGKSPAQN